MKKIMILSVLVFVMSIVNIVLADSFGSGENQFSIEFVNISGDPDSGGFGAVKNDYRIGKYEVTVDQWYKFMHGDGRPTGSPSSAYGYDGYYGWRDENNPAQGVSWYEAAQFVNFLNISTGNSPAYKFTGNKGTRDYFLGVWEVIDSGYDPINPFRNSGAKYFLPTENEWIRAGYFNGTGVQSYATKTGQAPTQGDGLSGTGWNFRISSDEPLGEPWNVGSGSEELNGTYDMMGNIWEWTESPYNIEEFNPESRRVIAGGSFNHFGNSLAWYYRISGDPDEEYGNLGFRVASVVPEPASMLLFGLGALVLRRRKEQSAISDPQILHG